MTGTLMCMEDGKKCINARGGVCASVHGCITSGQFLQHIWSYFHLCIVAS
jgi:hypothetical protein